MESLRHEVYRIIMNDKLYEAPIGDKPQVSPLYVEQVYRWIFAYMSLECFRPWLRDWYLGYVGFESFPPSSRANWR